MTMATATSFADVILDWERLLAAHEDNSGILGSAEPQRAALEGLLAEARELKARQDSFTAAKQQATDDLGVAVADGREVARRYRSAVKAVLGTRSQRLVQFGIEPLPERKPRRTPPPPPVEIAAPTPPAAKPEQPSAAAANEKTPQS